MANDGRISLRDDLQHKWFVAALESMKKRQLELSDYDHELMTKMKDGYELVGRDLTVTVKQLNHMKQVAADLEARRYG